MKVRDIIKEVEAKGWYFIGQVGSIGSTCIQRSKGRSRLPDSGMMISHSGGQATNGSVEAETMPSGPTEQTSAGVVRTGRMAGGP